MQQLTLESLGDVHGGIGPLGVIILGALASALLQPSPQGTYSPFQAQVYYDAYTQPVYVAPVQGPYGTTMQVVGQQGQYFQPYGYYPYY